MKSLSARLSLILMIFCLVFSLSACGGKTAETKEPSDTEGSTTQIPDLPGGEIPPAEPEQPETPTDDFVPSGNLNPLTGLCDGLSDDSLHNRPVAIMVSNIITSLPQWGVADADILFEMLAEGRITRLMAIYQDPAKIDHIASIRSARPYFIDMAQSFGAIYIHFGGSVPAYEAIAARTDLIDIDGIKSSWEGTVFFRDPGRKASLGSEHSVYTTGPLLQQGFSKLKADLSQENHPSAFNFGSSSSADNGEAAKKVQITFSENHKPYFEYNESTGEYLRYEYGAKQMDGWTNSQISVKNVLVLRMDTSNVSGNSLGLIEIQTTGSGDGLYFCDGKYIPIIWKKASYNSELLFYTKDNHEITFARGKTFISCCTRTGDIGIW